jgi:uncharacterized protein (TIGR04255 family)
MLRFPPQKDIRLQKAPLAEVVCQVRFPPILRIAEEKPVAFQEQIRKEFPQLEVGRDIVVVSSQDTSPPSAQSGSTNFRFKSRDGYMTVSLAPNFYALSTKSYTHWDDFLKCLLLINKAACTVYELPYATRIGLRYINRLSLKNTGVSDVTELLDILHPELTTLFKVKCWDTPLETLNQWLLDGGDGQRLTMRTGFKEEGENTFFLLDFDCFVEDDTALDKLPQLCEQFHNVIYSAFRWCIRDLSLFL